MEAFAMRISQWQYEDRREYLRVRLQLKLAVVYHQHIGHPTPPTYYGRTHDIGVSGLSMVIDRSIFHEGDVTVLLALPPTPGGAAQQVITSTAKMTYAIHSSKLKAFKIGVTFLEFKGNGKALLEAALVHASDNVSTIEKESPGLRRSRTERPRESLPPG